jgi:glucose/arabinose dehydrogenase
VLIDQSGRSALRNPFTFAFQPGTGRLFINDVGAGSWEEINDGIAGSNYGWPTCEGNCSPPNASFRDPLFQYAHSGSISTTGCAIVGGGFYNPNTVQFPASYVGKYFFADLCSGWIPRV